MIAKFYKTISNDLLKTLKINVERKYYYYERSNNENDKQFNTFFNKYFLSEVPVENDVNKVKLEDDLSSEDWDKENTEVYLDIAFHINNIQNLYSRNGVAYEDAVLGIGIEWKAANSKIKNCVKIGEISKKDFNKTLKYEGIKLTNFNSNITFNWVIYVSRVGQLSNSIGIINERGFVLGKGILWTIINEGVGSLFPIITYSDKNGPLWHFYCDYSDIYEDEFNDSNVYIALNEAHNLYQYYQINHKNFNPKLLASLLANALTILIIAIKEKAENNKINLNEYGQTGSIQYALKYFHDVKGFDINGDLNSLLISIEKFFDKEFK